MNIKITKINEGKIFLINLEQEVLMVKEFISNDRLKTVFTKQILEEVGTGFFTQDKFLFLFWKMLEDSIPISERVKWEKLNLDIFIKVSREITAAQIQESKALSVQEKEALLGQLIFFSLTNEYSEEEKFEAFLEAFLRNEDSDENTGLGV